MAENSKIEWCDHTFNPWIGCTAVSPACDNCYAEAMMDKRLGQVKWGHGQPRKLTRNANWRKPFAWNRKAEREDKPYRVFCASLADVFDTEVPDDWRDRLFALIALTPHLDWLLLTKRPKVAREYLTSEGRDEAIGWKAHEMHEDGNWGDYALVSGLLHGQAHDKSDFQHMPAWPLPNLWLGTTVENQKMADTRIPLLLDTPAAVRFLSCEPLLEEVDLTNVDPKIYAAKANAFTGKWRWEDGPTRKETAGLDWVICGGESGPNARPMHPDWARSLRDQCKVAGVPFFFKQWGKHIPLTESKSTDPRDLDGVEHNAFPGGVDE